MRRIPAVALVLTFLPIAPLPGQQPSGTSPAPIVRRKAAGKPAGAKAKSATKPETLVPLTQRQRALQMLDRFTFGPRPGDVDHVLAIGIDTWFEQQSNPDTIKDGGLRPGDTLDLLTALIIGSPEFQLH